MDPDRPKAFETLAAARAVPWMTKPAAALAWIERFAVVVDGYLDIDVVGATVRIGVFDLNVGVVDLSLLVDWNPEILGGLDLFDISGRLAVPGPGGLAPFKPRCFSVRHRSGCGGWRLLRRGGGRFPPLPPDRPRCRGQVRRA